MIHHFVKSHGILLRYSIYWFIFLLSKKIIFLFYFSFHLPILFTSLLVQKMSLIMILSTYWVPVQPELKRTLENRNRVWRIELSFQSWVSLCGCWYCSLSISRMMKHIAGDTYISSWRSKHLPWSERYTQYTNTYMNRARGSLPGSPTLSSIFTFRDRVHE